MRKARGSVPATFRENVFGVAAGDVEPPCDGADGRSRGLAPPQCVEDDVGLLFGARISAKRHECTARRPRPPERCRCQSSPSSSPLPPPAALHAICHLGLCFSSANAIPVTSPLERPSGTISAVSSSPDSSLFINSCFLAVSCSPPERLPEHTNLIMQTRLIIHA